MSERNIWADMQQIVPPSLPQDMQICANELKQVMKNVLAKREHTGQIKMMIIVCVMCWSFIPSCPLTQITK